MQDEMVATHNVLHEDTNSHYQPYVDNSTTKVENKENGLWHFVQGFIVRLVDTIVNWGAMMIMFVLPAITSSYVVVFSAALILGAIAIAINFVRYRYGLVKVFPKIFELGVLSINFSLVLFEVFAKPSYNWSLDWVSVIINAPLFIVTVISVLLGRPFTLEFAMESVSEELWQTPQFLTINYHITYVWSFCFLFHVIITLIFNFTASNVSYGVRITPGLVVLGLALLFTNNYPAFAREVYKTQQRKQQEKLQKEKNLEECL
jgi:hypothetical protein